MRANPYHGAGGGVTWSALKSAGGTVDVSILPHARIAATVFRLVFRPAIPFSFLELLFDVMGVDEVPNPSDEAGRGGHRLDDLLTGIEIILRFVGRGCNEKRYDFLQGVSVF